MVHRRDEQRLGRRQNSSPGAVGLGHDAGNLDAARRQLDHEQDGEVRQPATGPDFDRKEICGREGLPTQCGRRVTEAGDGCLLGKRFLLHDRDPLFTEAFRETLAAVGVQTVRLLPRSPNLNAYAERCAPRRRREETAM